MGSLSVCVRESDLVCMSLSLSVCVCVCVKMGQIVTFNSRQDFEQVLCLLFY